MDNPQLDLVPQVPQVEVSHSHCLFSSCTKKKTSPAWLLVFQTQQPAASSFQFGAAQQAHQQQTQQPASLFGAGATAGGLFGATAAQPQTSFGGFSQPGFGAAPAATGYGAAAQPTSGGLFGAGAGGFGATAPSLFGQTQAQPAQGGGLFGGPTTFGGSTMGNQTITMGTPQAQQHPAGFGTSFGTPSQGTAGTKFQPTSVQESAGSAAQFFSLTSMPQYNSKSFEELRLEDYQQNRKGVTSGAAPASLFGAGATGGFGNTGATFGASGFGATGGGFGATPATAATGFGGFGQPQPQPTTGFSFGNTGAAPAAQTSFGGAFGAPAQQQAASTFGGFGKPATAATTGTTGGLFGQPQASAPGFGFGASATAQPTAQTGFGFGATAQQSAPAAAPGGFGFGGGFGAPQASAPGFGASLTSPAAATGFGAPATGFGAPSLFGGAAQPAAGTAGFGFGQPAAAAQPTAQAGFSFGGAAQPAAATSFGFGASPTAKPAGTAGGFSFAGAQPTAAPQTGFSFGAGAQPAAAQTGLGGFGSSFGAAQPAGGFSTSFGLNTSTPQKPGYGASTMSPSFAGFGNAAFGASQLAPQPTLQTSIDSSPYGIPGFSGTTSTPKSETPDSTLRSEAVGEERERKMPPALPPSRMTPHSAAKIKQRGPRTPTATMDVRLPDFGANPDQFVPRRSPKNLEILDQDYLDKTPTANRGYPLDDSLEQSPSRKPMAPPRQINLSELQGGRKNQLTLSNLEYSTVPPIEKLREFSLSDLRTVRNFEIRGPTGSLKFPVADLSKETDLCHTVIFCDKSVIVYPHENLKPPLGSGLNQPAEVKLMNIFVSDKGNQQLFIIIIIIFFYLFIVFSSSSS